MKYRETIYKRYASVSGLSRPLDSKYKSLERNLTPVLMPLKGRGVLLDIGCGQGELLSLCKSMDIEAEGVDGSEELVASCRDRGLRVDFAGDLHAFLSHSKKRWIAVSMIDVIEHFSKSEALDILQKIGTVLEPDGRIILQTPNMQSPFATLNLFHDLTHEWGYTEASMHQLLKAAGYANVSLYAVRYPAYRSYPLRNLFRRVFYLAVRAALLVDQPNRGHILTPNLLAVAEV